MATRKSPFIFSPCLGREYEKTEMSEFRTLEKMTNTLNHTKIDLFKMDIQGYIVRLIQDCIVFLYSIDSISKRKTD
mgnify:CR=1 FL=1